MRLWMRWRWRRRRRRREGALQGLCCRAHARRKFFDLHKANRSGIAAEALQRIAALNSKRAR
jgi:hypothetical protein